MMERLTSRGERLAREAQRRQVDRVAQRLRGLFGSEAVAAEDGRVVVRGRGVMKRWLTDPAVRFLGGGMR